MPKIVFLNSLFIFLMIHLGAISISAAAETYRVDPAHSFAVFKIRHLGISYIIGGFSDISGMFVANRKNPVQSSVEIIIQTASIGTYVQKRDEHLRGTDFFHVEKYPTMRFRSKKIIKLDDTHSEVTGDFTMLGVTKPITITATLIGEGEDPWGGYRMGMESVFKIKRSDYGMTKLIPLAGDEVQISLIIEAVKK